MNSCDTVRTTRVVRHLTSLAFLASVVSAFLGGGCSNDAVSESPTPNDASTDVNDDVTSSPPPAAPPPLGPWKPVQMNDMSILFPLATTSAEHAAGVLAASAIGGRGTLLPEALYETVGHLTGSTRPPTEAPGDNGDALYANLAVVAMRLDPCFATLVPDPHGVGCKNQLRLVMQEMTVDPTTGQMNAFDSALHVFFSLTRDELLAVAQAVAALRVASGFPERLGALAPHPVMVAEGLTGPMATGVRALILQYAGAQNLTRVTKLSGMEGSFLWQFDGFDVTSADPPSVTPMTIPSLPGATTTQTFFRGFGTDPTGTFTPEAMGTDDISAFADVAAARQLATPALTAAVTAMARIENPALDSPDTVDCASCHLATPLSLLVAGPDFGLSELTDPAAFVADGTWVLPSEVQPTFNPATIALNVHAFSYVGRDAAINQRTANETAAIVAYLNANAPPP